MSHRAHWTLFAPLFLLLGAAPPPAPPTLSMAGLGDLRIGMTRAQVEALGHPVTPDDFLYDPEHPEACWEGRVGVDHVYAMFDDHRLVRLTATSSTIPIEGGARVGMAVAEVQAIYGERMTVEDHQGKPRLELLSDDGRQAMVMVSDGTHVRLVHAGEAQAAQYPEGCP